VSFSKSCKIGVLIVTNLREKFYGNLLKVDDRVPQQKDFSESIPLVGAAQNLVCTSPLLWSHGTGADVMKRVAAPMVGGLVTSTILTLVITPERYAIWKGRGVDTA
jgi:Cu/Ag efflux pump CusA